MSQKYVHPSPEALERALQAMGKLIQAWRPGSSVSGPRGASSAQKHPYYCNNMLIINILYR